MQVIERAVRDAGNDNFKPPVTTGDEVCKAISLGALGPTAAQERDDRTYRGAYGSAKGR